MLKPATAEAVRPQRAIEMQEQELMLLERLRKGEKLPDISGATAHGRGQARQGPEPSERRPTTGGKDRCITITEGMIA